MAIVTISRIKHRRGASGGPGVMAQLASAELGWATDQQELFIGNGTVTEGAPVVGNTQILTQHTNLSALLKYTYAGPFDGAVMQTGALASTPVIRDLIDRLDDAVDVRAFGAVADGDGAATDNILFFERAINQHTLNQPATNGYWSEIYVPAGTYNISRKLDLPSHTRLVGDGALATIIRVTTAATAVIELGTLTGPVYPTDIRVSGIGFATTSSSSNGLLIGNATDTVFDRCSFVGTQDIAAVGQGTSNAAVLFNNTATATSAVKFNNCLFTKFSWGVATDTASGTNSRQDISDISISNSRFYNLYRGILIGPEVDTNFSAPSNWRITNNTFDNITRHGIRSYRASKITSGQNQFRDVGNDNLLNTGVKSPVIQFGDHSGENPLTTALDLTAYENCYSIGDTFDRTDANDLLFKRVDTNALNSYTISPFEINYGSLHVEPGRLISLADNTTVAAVTGISFDPSKYQGAIIDYQITRSDNQRRVGTLTLALGYDAHTLMDDFTELATATGVVFSTTQAVDVGNPTSVVVKYTMTNGTYNAALTYSIRHLTDVLAVPQTP